VLAKAAITGIGLPDWVFPGALAVMILGLPAVLFTAYTHAVAHRAMAATPTFTPGGTAATNVNGTMASLALRARPHVTWKRTTTAGLAMLAAFVLLVGVFMTLRALGIGPSASLLATGALDRREPLLITDFRSRSADSGLGDVVTEAVRADLSQSGAISLVQPVTVQAALLRMRRPVNARVDLATAREIAAREGIKAIVDGEITPLGAGYVVSVSLVSADSGIVLTSFRTAVATPSELIDGINKVARQLRGKIGESLKSVHASPPLAQVTTSSLDALRKYTEGIRANRESDYPRAVALLREAVALDSSFATAWTEMATAMANGRPFPQSQQDSAQMMAYRFSDRMAADARTRMQARYFYTGPGRDLVRAAQIYDQILLADSNPNVANNLGNVLSGLGEFARAESVFKWTIARVPDLAFPKGNIVAVLFNVGKLAEADSMVALARRVHPEYLTAVIQSANLLYHKNDFAGYRRKLDSLRGTRVPRFRSSGALQLADFSLTVGRLDDFQKYLAEAREVDATTGTAASPLLDTIRVAQARILIRDEPQAAVQLVDNALSIFPLKSGAMIDRPYLALASTYAAAGRADRARDILRQFDADADTTMRRAHVNARDGVLGDIAIAEGKPREAIPLYRSAAKSNHRRRDREIVAVFARVGRAFDLAGEPDSAIANFERFLTTPAYARFQADEDPLLLASTYKRLGELYENKGDRQKAGLYYRKFVDLWHDADAELQPKVKEVQRKLERLTLR
jgi:tetratricopeptide (TPR) repeat protein